MEQVVGGGGGSGLFEIHQCQSRLALSQFNGLYSLEVSDNSQFLPNPRHPRLKTRTTLSLNLILTGINQ